MKLSELDYELPAEQIAQAPAPERDASRLVVLRRPDPSGAPHAPGIEVGVFRQLGSYLRPADLLVLNDTRVLPARLVGRKESGGRIEILLVEPARERVDGTGGEVWLAMASTSRSPRPGMRLDLGADLDATYLGAAPGGLHRVALRPTGGGSLLEALRSAGSLPLPHYIHRNGSPEAAAADAVRYQTVFAARDGAIAAPTAGLHFTQDLLRRLEEQGVGSVRLTLHVGPATFAPVRVEEIEDHPMTGERYEVPEEVAVAVARTRARKGRVVAVGTTVVRALETASDGRGGVLAARGRTDLYIVPGHRFRVVDALLTNFHLPRSTLLALVFAFGGREAVLGAYREALRRGLRFCSYGDAMLVL